MTETTTTPEPQTAEPGLPSSPDFQVWSECRKCGLRVHGVSHHSLDEAKARLGNNLRMHVGSKRCQLRRKYKEESY